MNGAELIRKRMLAARECGNVRRYLVLRRAWLTAQAGPRVVYGVLHLTNTDRRTFQHIEKVSG